MCDVRDDKKRRSDAEDFTITALSNGEILLAHDGESVVGASRD